MALSVAQELHALDARSGLRPFALRTTDVTEKGRANVIEWIMEVIFDQHNSDATLHLAVRLFDMVVCSDTVQVTRANIQLIGVTCLWMANKMEEPVTMSSHRCAEYTDHTYTYKDICIMERKLFAILRFNIHRPHLGWFCDRLFEQLCAVRALL